MNNYEHRQLLCTFSDNKNFQKTVNEIRNFYDIYNRRIFIFSNEKNPTELFLTYNVLNIQRNEKKLPNTILVHRKKQSNTIYTLNSLNVLVQEEHGCLDKTYMVDWKLYENSLILTGDVSVRIIPLKIFKIVLE